MEFLANNWFYFLIVGAMIYMMFRGGGCCGGMHTSHGGHGDSHGGHHEGGCCGGGHMDHGNMNPMGQNDHEERSKGYIENLENINMEDPVCGMYVSKQDAVVRQINGSTYYFCSECCANEFERKQAAKKDYII